MKRSTFSGDRALTFARGLYHVAACDGLDPREQVALDAFLEQVGLTTADLARFPGKFDFAEAARIFESTWLRRTFIRACRIVVQLDGVVSAAERDTLRALGVAMGVGEAFALADLEGPTPPPDALVRWVRELAIDFVSWDDEVKPGWFWRFPHDAHPLAEGGELRVEPGQALMVRAEGEFDLLGPGDHRVSPKLLPNLARQRGWQGGPVFATPIFLRTAPSNILRWGTTDPVMLPTEAFGPVPLSAFGRFSVRVADPVRFAQRFMGEALPDNAEMDLRVRRIFAGRFAQALLQVLDQGDDAERFACLEDLDALRTAVLPALKEALLPSGMGPARFEIENLTVPAELGLQPRSKRTRALEQLGRGRLGATRPPADTAPIAPVASVGQAESPAPPGATGTSEVVPRAVTGVALGPCVRCARPIPVDARFCDGCGAAQRKPCTTCGHSLPMHARFCSHCGQPQTA